jgi:nucleotide-binding universal stress UspA family protein
MDSLDWSELAGSRHYIEVLRTRLKEAHGTLGSLRERLLGQGIDISIAIKDNNFPDWSLSSAAFELRADLLVVGSESRSRLSQLAMGSTAEGVVRHSEVPVLVARENQEPAGTYRTILVPSDFSPAANRAFDLAVLMAADNANITLLHAIDTNLYGQGLADELEVPATEAARTLFVRHGQSKARFHFVLARASARDAITEHASRADLIAMGTHGRRGFARLFLGSVASYTIRHASCSVATVHPPKA